MSAVTVRGARSVLAAMVAIAIGGFPPARGDDSAPPSATLVCDPVAEPGRVRCEVEARGRAGESIAWGDVVLLQTPAFASALRGRIGPHDASVREPTRWRWTFAIVAHGRGAGTLDARVRMLVCRDGTCLAHQVEVRGKVEVGQ